MKREVVLGEFPGPRVRQDVIGRQDSLHRQGFEVRRVVVDAKLLGRTLGMRVRGAFEELTAGDAGLGVVVAPDTDAVDAQGACGDFGDRPHGPG
ncbi:hypothetical protein D3C72_1922800 [compost metagenome]